MTKKTDIVCLGEPLVEFNERQPDNFIRGIGGDTSNCAVSAARQGARVGYITSLGNDPFGDSIIAMWKNEGIDVSAVLRSSKAPTGIYFVTHDEQGHHFTYYRKGSAAAQMRPADLSEKSIAEAGILHVSAISQAISESAIDTVIKAIEIANSNNTLVSYDTNLRLNLWPLEQAKEVIHRTMSQCQIALPSYDDACQLTGETDYDRIIDFYLDLGAKTVALKIGARGARLHSDGKRLDIPAFKVDSIDANAAGDTFAGAFLAEYSRTKNAEQSAQFANAAAALSTCRSGAVSSIPNYKEVVEFVKKF